MSIIIATAQERLLQGISRCCDPSPRERNVDRAGRNFESPSHLIRLRRSFPRAQCPLSQLFLIQSEVLVGRGHVGKDPAQTLAFRFPALAQAARGLIPELLRVIGHASIGGAPFTRARNPQSTARTRSGLQSTERARKPCRRFLADRAHRGRGVTVVHRCARRSADGAGHITHHARNAPAAPIDRSAHKA
jgi:hypothetical protein